MGGKDLADGALPRRVVDEDEVSERSADVDANAVSFLCLQIQGS
jgi:hypothetical protein